MSYQKILLGDTLIDGYNSRIGSGEVRLKIDTSLAEAQKGLFAKVGLSADGIELASINEVKLDYPEFAGQQSLYHTGANCGAEAAEVNHTEKDSKFSSD